MSAQARRRAVRGATCVLSVAALLLLAACGGSTPEPQPGDESQPEDGQAETEPIEEPIDESVEEASVEPLPRSSVEVYFPSAAENGLVGEFREIFATATAGDQAKQIIADLISGPTSRDALRAVPPNVRLRQVYVLESGVAYLDFTSELTEGTGGGSMNELLTVYSIVDSVVLNVRQIHRVAILINGRTPETLNGHIDLRRPLSPDTTLILGSIIVERRDGGATRPVAALQPGGGAGR
jgi:hypothetical protein